MHVSCTTEKRWMDDSGKVLFQQIGSNRPVDCRTTPPFYQILPCPYCGVLEDKNHDPLKHVDPQLGTLTKTKTP